jgi:hypothetical protein
LLFFRTLSSNFATLLPGSLAITGSFAPAAPLPDRGAVRLDVKFESFTLKFGWLKLRVPLTWVNPTG